MKDFPNYLLQTSKMTEKLPVEHTKKLTYNESFATNRRNFKPSEVPSILRGITNTHKVDYQKLKHALHLSQQEMLLFVTDNEQREATNDVFLQTQKNTKRLGVKKTLAQLVKEQEAMHYTFAKGD